MRADGRAAAGVLAPEQLVWRAERIRQAIPGLREALPCLRRDGRADDAGEGAQTGCHRW